MNRQLKKYLSVFLLFLFLFPMAEKELHAYEHKTDAHCTSTDKHFHQEEHSCSLCDLTITSSNELPSTDVTFIVPSENFSYQPFFENVHTPDAFQNLPSRAPPVA